jgi:hypothetical protein
MLYGCLTSITIYLLTYLFNSRSLRKINIMSRPEKKPRVFKTESGEELPICPVSEVDLTPFLKRLKKIGPQPPVEIVEGVAVANEAHPDYLAALQDDNNLEQGTFMLAVYLELGLDLELDEDQQATVNRAKRKLSKVNPGAPENEFELYIYAKSVCPSMAELTRLMQSIQALNNPTAQQVQNALETFRPDVPRAAPYGDQDAPKWSGVPNREPEAFPLPGGEVGGDRDTALLRETIYRVAG